MRILLKRYFTWREPKPFLADLDEQDRVNRRWWHQPAGVVVIGAVSLFVRFIAQFDPAKHPPPFLDTLLMGLAIGVLLVYLMPWLITKSQSQIIVFDRRMVRFRGHNAQITFADLKSFAWRTSAEFSTLIFTDRSGAEILVGVPNDVPSDALRAFLSERILSNELNACSAMKTKNAIALALYTLLVGGMVGAIVGAHFQRWRQGYVVSEAASGSLKIRQIPTEFPGMNDSYAYRCEIWRGTVLYKATTLRHANFAGQTGKCSIDVISPSRAAFHIGGYEIECTDFGTGSDTNCNVTWKRLNK